jgi:type IV fimbrial biogenesis protein FimT
MMVCKTVTATRPERAQSGITLMETMVVVSILAILAGMALPSFTDMILNHRLQGKAFEYVTNMNWARSLAVSSNQPVNLRITAGESASCYVVFHGPDDECSCNASGAVCATAGNNLLVVVFPRSEGVRVSAGTVSESAVTRINPKQGMITPTLTAIFSADNGKAIHNVSNILGRTRSCTPNGAYFGHPAC